MVLRAKTSLMRYPLTMWARGMSARSTRSAAAYRSLKRACRARRRAAHGHRQGVASTSIRLRRLEQSHGPPGLAYRTPRQRLGGSAFGRATNFRRNTWRDHRREPSPASTPIVPNRRADGHRPPALISRRAASFTAARGSTPRSAPAAARSAFAHGSSSEQMGRGDPRAARRPEIRTRSTNRACRQAGRAYARGADRRLSGSATVRIARHSPRHRLKKTSSPQIAIIRSTG